MKKIESRKIFIIFSGMESSRIGDILDVNGSNRQMPIKIIYTTV
jgi:hypothetical protein